nr:MAG TPA: hypothetical protein [Caudoviricetes sp.]DAQ36154.1 MAG TPA: hypothetical protein [Caudoviricetes sp.]
MKSRQSQPDANGLQIVFEWCTNTTLTLYKGTNFS